MTDVALLNPQADLAAARKLLDRVAQAVNRRQEHILSGVTDFDTYLQAMGAFMALSELHQELTEDYRRMISQ